MKAISATMRRQAEKLAAKLGIGFTAALTMVMEAQAALPTEATAAFTALAGHVTDILAAVWPIASAVTGGFVLLKLFKRGANRAV